MLKPSGAGPSPGYQGGVGQRGAHRSTLMIPNGTLEHDSRPLGDVSVHNRRRGSRNTGSRGREVTSHGGEVRGRSTSRKLALIEAAEPG
jgi:hypothetical protein